MTRIGDSLCAVVEREEIDFARGAADFLFLGLRMTEGVAKETFRAQFGKMPEEFYPKIKTWIDGGFLEEKQDYLRLTPKGLLMANSIFVEFM
jgi:oxygen-independent coproporphyrinogen-3 oxidase